MQHLSSRWADVAPGFELAITLLHDMGVDPSTVVGVVPMAAGLSGARIFRLQLCQSLAGDAAWYTTRVLKVVVPTGSWLAALAEDRVLREVQLHRLGLLADLPHGMATGVLAYALAGAVESPGAGALLMRDERAHLLKRPTEAPLGRLPERVLALLEALARLHARFWQDPRVRVPAVGLMAPRSALHLLDPTELVRLVAGGDPSSYLPLALAGWESFFALAGPVERARLRAVLAQPEPYLEAITALPETLLHGDVWGPNLGWLPPRHAAPHTGHGVLLLDWALAQQGPATFDPLWLCGTWHALRPTRVLAAYRARLERHLRARGVALAPATWRALADAGYLRTALTCGEALGRAAVEAPPGATRRLAEARVRWWASRAARAAERLMQAQHTS